MGRMYECSSCEHVQLVGVIDNGLSGYADPHEVCENCGTEGQFHFAPGASKRMREQIANAVRVDPPDAAAFKQLDSLWGQSVRSGGAGE